MPDGRLFISEDPEEEENQEAKGGKRKRSAEPMDDLEEMMDEELAQFKKV